jgi:hypothetical protein
MTLEENKLKKHAYLITAYNNQYQLEQLLSLLNHERNDIYLQIDSMGSLCIDTLTFIYSGRVESFESGK